MSRALATHRIWPHGVDAWQPEKSPLSIWPMASLHPHCMPSRLTKQSRSATAHAALALENAQNGMPLQLASSGCIAHIVGRLSSSAAWYVAFNAPSGWHW